MKEITLAAKLEELRKSNGFTKRFVSEETGIAYGTYCGYEYGRRDPDTKTIAKLAEFYDCTVDELLGIEKAAQEEPPVSMDELVQFLVSSGIISEGEDLSDADLRFLKAVIVAVGEWFNDRKA